MGWQRLQRKIDAFCLMKVLKYQAKKRLPASVQVRPAIYDRIFRQHRLCSKTVRSEAINQGITEVDENKKWAELRIAIPIKLDRAG